MFRFIHVHKYGPPPLDHCVARHARHSLTSISSLPAGLIGSTMKSQDVFTELMGVRAGCRFRKTLILKSDGGCEVVCCGMRRNTATKM